MTIAAAESAEPEKAVAKATNSVITRVLLFYVGSILLVVCMVPWNDGTAIASPYVSALEEIGIPGAGEIMNAIVLTAVLSALNSGLYASSRMLFALTSHGDAPSGFRKLTSRGVPARAILIGTVFGYVSVVMAYISPDTVFSFLVNSYGTVALFVYMFIAISQLRLRKQMEREAPERLRVRMWLFPYLAWATIACMVVIVAAMAFIPEQQSQLGLGVVSLVALLVAYAGRTRWASTHATTPAAAPPSMPVVHD